MVCGVDDVLCNVLAWVSENGAALKDGFKPFVEIWEQLFSPDGQLYLFLKANGEKLIAAATFSFAVWRWWLYREAILHKRLEEYLAERDNRISTTAQATLDSLLRPEPGALVVSKPNMREFRRILSSNNWDKDTWQFRFGFSNLERAVDWRLGQSLKGIQRRARIASIYIASLNEQQSQLHMLAGAIAAIEADQASDPAQVYKLRYRAVREYDSAQRADRYQIRFDALENKALQWCKLGDFERALDAYRELAELADKADNERSRDLFKARALRYQAQILQVQSEPVGSPQAWQPIRPRNSDDREPYNSALALREKYEDNLATWEKLEQAETHYVAAFIASLCGYNQKFHEQIGLACKNYGELEQALPRRFRFLLSRRERHLYDTIREGSRRATTLQKNPADYDLDWLSFKSSGSKVRQNTPTSSQQ